MGIGLGHKEEAMKCPVCKHGETRPGRATITLARGESTVVFKDVPAEVCENCGEAFHSEQVAHALLAQAKDAARAGVRWTCGVTPLCNAESSAPNVGNRDRLLPANRPGRSGQTGTSSRQCP